jgi:succinylarginine dihydrolase
MREWNFDGLVGPTHNYAGLSHGNVASTSNEGTVSRPRDAALQGLEKMAHLAGLGVRQGVLPPQERPDVRVLRRLGFTGEDHEVIARASAHEPLLLARVSSASSMWAANAATVVPSTDTKDGRVAFVPSNLQFTFHRSLEPEATRRALARTFPDPARFVVHEPLPTSTAFGDEGAANHTRLTGGGARGVHVFVYGRVGLGADPLAPAKYPARQTLEASRAVARLAGLSDDATVFVRQAPSVIDAGVFHNDVICVGHENVLFFHERAFADPPTRVLADIERALTAMASAMPTSSPRPLVPIVVRESELSVEEAVSSYLFNSQLVTTGAGVVTLVAPIECEEHARTRAVLERVLAEDNPIRAVSFIDVRQSMRNGGGPACLRLRVPLTESEEARLHAPQVFDDALYARLREWVTRHYREELSPKDLGDPSLLEESRVALDALTQILDLGSLYPFQQ